LRGRMRSGASPGALEAADDVVRHALSNGSDVDHDTRGLT
jgi:hypothetical protein